MKVGDYVRTKYGSICKIINLETYCNLIIETDKGDLIKDNIAKTSSNLIDLIEVGDYVNGHTVKMIKEDKSKIDIGEGEDYFWLRNQDIFSIVTKESMESVTYYVK